MADDSDRRQLAERISLTRRKWMGILGGAAGAGAVGAQQFEGGGEGDLTAGGISTSLTDMRKRSVYYTGPNSAFDLSQVKENEAGIITDAEGLFVKDSDGTKIIPPVGSAANPVPSAHIGALDANEVNADHVGSDVHSGIQSISSAISAASEGDTVFIPAGNHGTDVTIADGKQLTIRGAGTASDHAGSINGTILGSLTIEAGRGILVRDLYANGGIKMGYTDSLRRTELRNVRAVGSGSGSGTGLDMKDVYRCVFNGVEVRDWDLCLDATFNPQGNQLSFFGCDFNQAQNQAAKISRMGQSAFFGCTFANSGIPSASPTVVFDASEGLSNSIGFYNCHFERQSTVVTGEANGIYLDNSLGLPLTGFVVKNCRFLSQFDIGVNADQVKHADIGPLGNSTNSGDVVDITDGDRIDVSGITGGVTLGSSVVRAEERSSVNSGSKTLGKPNSPSRWLGIDAPHMTSEWEVSIGGSDNVRWRYGGSNIFQIWDDKNRSFVPFSLEGNALTDIETRGNASAASVGSENLVIDTNRGGTGNTAFLWKDGSGTVHYWDADGTL